MEEKQSSQNDSQIQSQTMITKKKNSILPLLEKESLNILKKTKRIQSLNFNVMLNLPIIVKEKGIFERKNTLKVFNKRKIEDSISGNRNTQVKDEILKPGKIYINEFWSNKYQQSILKDSKIQEQIDQIKGLVRKNVIELVDDVHDAIQHQYGDLKFHFHIIPFNRDIVKQYEQMASNYKSSQRSIEIAEEEEEDPNQILVSDDNQKVDFVNNSKIDEKYILKIYKLKNDAIHKQKQNRRYHSTHQSEKIIFSPRTETLNSSRIQVHSNDITGNPDNFRVAKDFKQFNEDFSSLMLECEKFTHPHEDLNLLKQKLDKAKLTNI